MREPRTSRHPAPGRKPRRDRRGRSAPVAAEPTSEGATTSVTVAGAPVEPEPAPVAAPRRSGFTGRALVLLVVLLILGLPYANSVRIVLDQQRELSAAQQEVTDRRDEVAELESQLERWRDPAYVQSQARTQLGFVMPGETGFRVIGADGTVLKDSDSAGTIASAQTEASAPWWEKLSRSIEVADDSNG